MLQEAYKLRMCSLLTGTNGLSSLVIKDWIVSPAPNPQPGGPGVRIYDLRRQGGPAVPPGTGYPF
jgi:hypothetical protein